VRRTEGFREPNEQIADEWYYGRCWAAREGPNDATAGAGAGAKDL